MGWPVRPPRSIVVSSHDPGSPEPAILGSDVNKRLGVGIKSDHRIIIGSFNAQSIRNKTASILHIISEHSLDIFSIVEIWVEPEHIEYGPSPPMGLYVMTDLEHRMFPEIVLRGAGGVALVFRAAFHYRKLDFDLNPQTFEFLAVMLTLGGIRTLVVTIYRPDGRNNAFYGKFEST